MPASVSIECVSCLPQYCAVSMIRPDEMPVKNSISTSCTCDARLAAASAVCPTELIISTSAELTAAVIRFCNAIGATKTNSDL